MRIKVCILSDYGGGWLDRIIKRTSPNDDYLIKINDDILEFSIGKENDICDYIVVINKVNKNIQLKARRIIAIQQEPYIRESRQYAIPFKNEWAITQDYYDFCDIVYAFNDELFRNKNLICSNPQTFIYNKTIFIKHHPALYFLFGDIKYKDLCEFPIPNKTKEISCIASFDKRAFYGHLDRMKFVNALKKSHLGDRIDFFGNKTQNELKEKKMVFCHINIRSQ